MWGGLFSIFDCTLVAVRHKASQQTLILILRQSHNVLHSDSTRNTYCERSDNTQPPKISQCTQILVDVLCSFGGLTSLDPQPLLITRHLLLPPNLLTERFRLNLYHSKVIIYRHNSLERPLHVRLCSQQENRWEGNYCIFQNQDN